MKVEAPTQLNLLSKPCASCPWRTDQDASSIPNFDLALAEKLAGCCPDKDGMGPNFGAKIFACHQSKVGAEFACAGWMATVGHRHPAVRTEVAFKRLDAAALSAGADWPELHPNFQEVIEKLRATDPAIKDRGGDVSEDDKRILALVGDAAGYSLDWCESWQGGEGCFCRYVPSGAGGLINVAWNPFKSALDCRQLAIDLGFSLDVIVPRKPVWLSDGSDAARSIVEYAATVALFCPPQTLSRKVANGTK